MLSNEELMQVKGGALSGAIIDAMVNMMNTIFDLGRALGTSIRRVISKKYCKMN